MSDSEIARLEAAAYAQKAANLANLATEQIRHGAAPTEIATTIAAARVGLEMAQMLHGRSQDLKRASKGDAA
jgi:hypothetical protein